MINALSCFHPELHELDDDQQFRMAAARLISKILTIAAYAHRHSVGRPYHYPDPRLRYVPNFMHMMFSQPFDQYECNETVRDALNLVLILHADHEQNCSTSTVRMVGSSQANMFTVMFAIGRLPGWIAHWREQHRYVTGWIARPRQIYTGNPQIDYLPTTERGKDR